MLTRRDALKLAALAAATNAPLATITPAEAARLLDEPMGAGPAIMRLRYGDGASTRHLTLDAPLEPS